MLSPTGQPVGDFLIRFVCQKEPTAMIPERAKEVSPAGYGNLVILLDIHI